MVCSSPFMGRWRRSRRRGASEGRGRIWARAKVTSPVPLADLLGPDAHITAIDKDANALRGLSSRFETRVADFTKPLDLHDLDGVVMANSLHFVRDKQPVLEAVRAMLKPGGRTCWGPLRGNRSRSRQPVGALPLHLSAVGKNRGPGRLREHQAPAHHPEPLAREHVCRHNVGSLSPSGERVRVRGEKEDRGEGRERSD